MSAKKSKEIPEKFEEALGRLEQIVEVLEAGEVDLEKSLELFEEGRRLSEHCLARLQEMETKVKKAMEKADGSVELKPFDAASALENNRGSETP